MTEDKAIALFKCLSDRSRLQILKSLAVEPMYVERLAERLSLTPPTVSFHLKKLEAAGLVGAAKEQYYTLYHLEDAALRVDLMNIIREESSEISIQQEREKAYRDKVIQNFFVYGKLKSIPAQRKKRRIILEEMVALFKPGKQYPEKEVNLIIADVFDDFCTIRREMVDEGLMERENNVYWRTKA